MSIVRLRRGRSSTVDTADGVMPGASSGVEAFGWPVPVWLVVDGTRPLERGLARTVIRLVWEGHFVTVVVAIPRQGWTLNARLIERQHRQRAEWLRKRHDELTEGLCGGLGEGPVPQFSGGGRIRIRWTTAPRPGWRWFLRALLWGRDSTDGAEPLQRFTGLRLNGMPARPQPTYDTTPDSTPAHRAPRG